MTTGTLPRCWLLGVICLAAAVAGCAAPAGMSSASSLWSGWFQSAANDRFSDAQRKLKDPVKLNLAYARFKEDQGDIAEARRRYEFVLGKQPKSADAILGLARLDHLAGRRGEAEQGFKRAIKLHPNDPRVLDAVGQFYASQERWSEAVEMLNAAMRAAPDDLNYRYHLAVALARSGDLSGAMPHFAKTIGFAQAHYNIGYILYEQGRLDAAEEHFMQAVVQKPDLKPAQEMLDTVRREREDRLMLAGAQPTRSTDNRSAPDGPFQPTYPVDYRAPSWQGGPAAVVNPAHFQPAPRPNHQSAPESGQLPGLPPQRYQPDYPGHSPAQPAGSLSQQPPPPTPPSVSQPRAPSSGMAPQQFEQWKNQIRGMSIDN